jgi:uncharacterized membrane protein YeaQ/YmgE (transglycosylase-associated protein family)
MKTTIQSTRQTTPRVSHRFNLLAALTLLALAVLLTAPALAADDATLSQKADQTIDETKKATSDSLDTLWQRVDEARLKNRSPDEIIAWLFTGVLVGSVACMVTSLKPSAPRKIGILVSGLVGAFIGGIIVSVTRVNFGWGPVLIRYEELVFSFVGAILLVLIGRFIGLKKLF